jgi:hypothetical protein
MLRDELTLKWMKEKMGFGFGYPRACRFRKTKLRNQFRSPYLYHIFSKRDFNFMDGLFTLPSQQ